MQSLDSGHTRDAYTACWALWPNPDHETLPIQRAIDQSLSGYLFYPEPEWPKHGYRPPENFPLLGAWRNTSGTVFAFLLNSDPDAPQVQPRQVLLYVAGEKDAVEEVGGRVTALKSVLAKSERREMLARYAERRLDDEYKSKSVSKLVGLVGLFTVVINGFSLYLRQLPSPEFASAKLVSIYQLLVGAIHFAALSLLLIITIIGIGYVIRYGILMLRRF